MPHHDRPPSAQKGSRTGTTDPFHRQRLVRFEVLDIEVSVQSCRLDQLLKGAPAKRLLVSRQQDHAFGKLLFKGKTHALRLLRSDRNACVFARRSRTIASESAPEYIAVENAARV